MKAPAAINFQSNMPETKSRLIESALRTLEDDAEVKLAAGQLLGERVKSNSGGAKTAIARRNAVEAKPGKHGWQTTLWLALIVVSATVLMRDHLEVGRYMAGLERIPRVGLYSQKSQQNSSAICRANKHCLSENPMLSATEELWRLAPDNSAYFAEYAVACARDSIR